MHIHHIIEGNGPAVVLLHGLFGSSSNLSGLARHLAKQYTVIRLDLPNHGKSEHCASMDYDFQAGQVSQVLDQLGISRYSVIGHSMGGKVAMQLMLAGQSQIDCGVIVDIAPVQYAADAHNSIFKAMLDMPLADIEGRQAADEFLQQYIAEPSLRSFILTNLLRQGQEFTWRLGLAQLHAAYASIAKAPIAYTRYNRPVMVIRGGLSDYVRAEYKASFQPAFSNVDFKQIDGAGHWPHISHAQQFNTTISHFLGEIHAS